MEPVDGAAAFRTSGDAYDSFMGRYSAPLASLFADTVGVAPGQTALDVGCGPGALTGVLVQRLGSSAVAACDPSPQFVAECARRCPGVDVRLGRAEELPFHDAQFDVAVAQLVLHFVSDPSGAAGELRRVVRPGGVVGANVWNFPEMELLRLFWDAALAADPAAPDELRTRRFGGPGEIAALLAAAGIVDIEETTLHVTSTYRGFDELWAGLAAGVGPAGSYCAALPEPQRNELRRNLFERLGSPDGPITLGASARCAHGTVPDEHRRE